MLIIGVISNRWQSKSENTSIGLRVWTCYWCCHRCCFVRVVTRCVVVNVGGEGIVITAM